jgi:hypothetical protein
LEPEGHGSLIMDTLTDPEATRVVWRWGGYGSDVDFPGAVLAVLTMLVATTRKGQRVLWQSIGERSAWGGRGQVTDLTAWLRSLLLAIRTPQRTPDPRHADAPPGGARDVVRQIAPTRGAPAPAGALAGGSTGRPPD